MDIEEICNLTVHEEIGRAKTVPESEYVAAFAKTEQAITAEVDRLIKSAREEQ